MKGIPEGLRSRVRRWERLRTGDVPPSILRIVDARGGFSEPVFIRWHRRQVFWDPARVMEWRAVDDAQYAGLTEESSVEWRKGTLTSTAGWNRVEMQSDPGPCRS